MGLKSTVRNVKLKSKLNLLNGNIGLFLGEELMSKVRIVTRLCSQSGYEQSDYEYKTVVVECKELFDLVVRGFSVLGAENVKEIEAILNEKEGEV